MSAIKIVVDYLTIHRGESIYNHNSLTEKNQSSSTLLSDGMLSNAVLNGGQIETIDEEKLVQFLLNHVSHIKEDEREYRKRSDYISFSTKKEKALAWAAQVPSPKADQDLGLLMASAKEATRYLVTVEISDDHIRWNPTKSLGFYYYRCNPSKRSSPLGMDPVLSHSLCHSNCSSCALNPHAILIVHVEQFLKEVKSKYCTSKNEYQFKRAIKLAYKHSEVALFPSGYNPKYGGIEARIPHADFWNIEYYIKQGESR